MKSSLIQLLKNSRFIESLRGDPSYDRTPRPMRDSFYSLVEPDRVPQPQLLSVSGEMLEELCLSAPLSQEDIDILSGNRISQARPYASCYGGHQFGHWAGQLGDGRAINLGEISGNNQMWELQLKGSGLTPFSRTADGKAVLRSSVREFLMSEAMYHLGVPTTRALSLIQTGEAVLRDLLYDGHPAYEPGAIVCRVAPSFLRFGHFEILAARDEKENLRQLIDFTIANFFPEIDPQNPKALVSLFKEVQSRSIQMVIDWQRIGFVHGVMNTDNMSILGLTIDYGPFAMMDRYDSQFTPNTTDLPGRRYAYSRQPAIVNWNLQRLRDVFIYLSPNLEKDLFELNHQFEPEFHSGFRKMLLRKWGLQEGDLDSNAFLQESFAFLEEQSMDFTAFFRNLLKVRKERVGAEEEFINGTYQLKSKDFEDQARHYLKKYQKLCADHWSDEGLVKAMETTNPQYILRNYQLHQLIQELGSGEEGVLWKEIWHCLKNPYSHSLPEKHLTLAPEWAFKTPGCSTLSCSS